MIPKIIHCCWFGGKKTRLAQRCLASWRKFAPAWEVREWDIKTLRREFGAEDLGGRVTLPDFVEQALAVRQWAFAADWARFAVLECFGGAYFDFDEELVASIDHLDKTEWGAAEWLIDGSARVNPGAGIALGKGSPIAKAMLEYYAAHGLDCKTTVGEILENILHCSTINLQPSSCSLTFCLPPEVFSPIDCKGRIHRTANTLGIHHYAMSWAPWWRKALQWLSWHGGRPLVDFALSIKRKVVGV